jgi:hypothetical protein
VAKKFKDSKIQGFKNSRIQKFKDSNIQRFKDLRKYSVGFRVSAL